MKSIKFLLVSLGVVAFASLSGCGSSSSSSAASNIIDVTPAKGAFSSGTVEAYTSSGVKITTGTLSSGSVSLDTGSNTGVLILKVTGTFYDEGTGLPETLSSPLLALIPDATYKTSGNTKPKFGITPLTNMAAELAGVTVSGSALDLTNAGGSITATTIRTANKSILSFLGLSQDAFDITSVPTLLSSTSLTVDGTAAGIYATVLAKISWDAKTAGQSILTMLSNLKTAAASAKTTGTFTPPAALIIGASGMTFSNVSGLTGLSTATSAAAAVATAPTYTVADAANIAAATSQYCTGSTTKLDPLYAGNSSTLSSATGTGTFNIRLANGSTYSYPITYSSGKVYGIPNSGSSSQSGVFTGSVSGSSGGSDGWIANSIYLLSGISGSGTLTLTYSGGSGTYTLGVGTADTSGQKKVTLSCS